MRTYQRSMAVVNEDDTYAHFWDDLLADKNHSVFLFNPADVYAQRLPL